MILKLAVAKINFHFIKNHILFKRNNKGGVPFLYSSNGVYSDYLFFRSGINNLAAAKVIS